MGQPARRRVKVSATLDPELIDSVDAFLDEHPDRDRSSIIDEALWLWLAQEQERATIEQFSGEGAPEEEMRGWRKIQAEAARHVFRRNR